MQPAAPWCTPREDFSTLGTKRLARRQDGRRRRIAASSKRRCAGTCALHPNAMERGHTPSRGGWKRPGWGGGGEDDQPETPQTDFSVLHSRHPRSEGAGSVPLPPVTPPSTSPCSVPPRPWVPRPDIVPRRVSPGQAPPSPVGRYLLATASSHHGIRFLRPSALPRSRLCGTPGEGEGGDGGISLPSGATPAPTSGKPPATPTSQPQHPGVLHTGTG